MKKFRIILPILFLIAVGCDDDSAVVVEADLLARLPIGRRTMTLYHCILTQTKKFVSQLTDINKLIRRVKG